MLFTGLYEVNLIYENSLSTFCDVDLRLFMRQRKYSLCRRFVVNRMFTNKYHKNTAVHSYILMKTVRRGE